MNDKKTIYIAGPMRHRVGFNFHRFDYWRDMLRFGGYEVISPADLDREAGFDALELPEDYDWDVVPEGFDFEACVDRDIEAIKKCDAVFLLHGWQDSLGTRAEKALAEWLGKEILYEEDNQWGSKNTELLGIPPKQTTVPVKGIPVEEIEEHFGPIPEVKDAVKEVAIKAGVIPNDGTVEMRKFESGATRNSDEGKLDYEAFLSPAVLEEFAKYMHAHRKQADGTMRDGDNWQNLFGEHHYKVCMKSFMRHCMDLWFLHRGYRRYCPEDGHELSKKEMCCAIMFNVMAYLFKLLKEESDA